MCPLSKEFQHQSTFENSLQVRIIVRRHQCLQNHVFRKHVKSVKCAYCEVVMDCASAVAKHMKIVHAKVKNEKCPECGIKFGLKTDLQKHIDAIHKSEPQFACRYCPKRFRWVKQQITHEKTHCEVGVLESSHEGNHPLLGLRRNPISLPQVSPPVQEWIILVETLCKCP